MLNCLNKRFIFFIFWCIPFLGYGNSEGFIKNQGQFYDQFHQPVNELLYMAHSNGISIQLYKDHFAYEIKKEPQFEHLNIKGSKEVDLPANGYSVSYSRVEFFFGNQVEVIQENKKSKTYYNFINPFGEFNEAPLFEELIYKNVFEGIDIQFLMDENGFKYNLIVNEGSSISDIQFEIKGSNETLLEENQLTIQTDNGTIIESIPTSYLVLSEDQKKVVDIEYYLEDRILKYRSLDPIVLSTQQKLIIDPVPDIIWATYTGGEGGEYCEGVVIDSNLNINATGFTGSTTNIATTGAFDGTMDGVFDIYLVQYAPDGTKNWGTYFGNFSYDRAYGITCSNDNNLYITGNTQSPGMATAGVQQTTQVNGDEAILAKFDNNGFRIWSTYYGGDQHDFGAVVVVDDNNNSYITGHTYSSDYIATAGMYKETFTGLSNAFISKFDDNGILLWGTYYGEQLEEGWGIGLDDNANVYVGGGTQSSFGIASTGAHQTVFGGYNDAFLTKFDTDGNQIWGTYYGDVNSDQAYGLAVDIDGNCYLTGITSSPVAISFGDVYQPAPASIDDGFVAKFDTDGVLEWGTYVGGDGADYLYNIDFGPDSNIVVVGMTLSLVNVAQTDSYDDSWNAFYDGFIVSLTKEGDWRFGTYYGGEDHDEIRDVDVDPSNYNIVIVGTTQSTTSMTTSGAETEVFPGGTNDSFMARFCNPILAKLVGLDSLIACDSQDELVYVSNAAEMNSITWSTSETTDSIYISGLSPGSYSYSLTGIDTNGCATKSDTINFEFYSTNPPSFSVNTNPICANDTLTLSTNSGFESYQWYSGGTDTLEQTLNLFSADSVATYLTVIDSNGCTITSDTTWVEIWPLPDATISLDSNAPYCIEDSIFVSVDMTDSYSWNNGETTQSTFYLYNTPGNYDIIVQTISNNGCIDNDTLKLNIGLCDIGMKELSSSDIRIFPIPFENLINIKIEEPTKLLVYNVVGEIVFSETLIFNSNQINLDYLSAGTYTFVLLNSQGTLTKKIVKL